MQTVIIVIHLLIVLALVGLILIQRSEGGGLGLGGGGGVQGFMTGRGQTNALTRTTAVLATGFFVTSLALSILASANRAPRSILDGSQPAPIGAPAPLGAPIGTGQGGGVLDQLQGGSSAPAPTQTPPAPPEQRVPQSR